MPHSTRSHVHASRRISARAANVRGVTLIELIVALAMLAILIGLAVPSFTSVINSNRLSGQVNELVAAFQGARMEAIRRNARVVICPSTDQFECGGTWTSWISFVDRDGDGVRDTGVGNDETLLRTGTIAAPVKLLAGEDVDDGILVGSDGMARTYAGGAWSGGSLLNARLRFCIESKLPSKNQRDLEINAGSRVTVYAEGDGSGTCDAP